MSNRRDTRSKVGENRTRTTQARPRPPPSFLLRQRRSHGTGAALAGSCTEGDERSIQDGAQKAQVYAKN